MPLKPFPVFSPQCNVKVKVKSLSRVQLFVIPWTVAYQPPPSMGFSRQEYWSGLPFPLGLSYSLISRTFVSLMLPLPEENSASR